MRKRMWSVLGVLGLLAGGCGSTADLSCKSDKDCLESELCHPDLLICVQVCITSATCPTKAKTCEAISDTDRTKICKCTKSTCKTLAG
jgi:hypothetical protein